MSILVLEAALIGLKEALKLGAVWFIVRACLRTSSAKDAVLRPMHAGLIITLLLTAASFLIPTDEAAREFTRRLVGFVFFVFFSVGMIALFYEGREGGLSAGIPKIAVSIASFILTVLYFLPDMLASSLYIHQISHLKEKIIPVYLSGALGFAITLFAIFAILRKRDFPFVERFFGLGQVFVLLALIKLLGGGTEGFAEISMVPSLQRGAMKFVHDFIHQTFVFLMVPDHPILRTTTWNFIGIFFGANFGLFIAMAILLLPPSAYIYHSLTSVIPAPESALTGADKRLYRATERGLRRMRAVVPAVFILFVFSTWFIGSGEQAIELYLPAPKPVVNDKGSVIIPLTDPTMDLKDGRIHKFSLNHEGDIIRLLVIRKPGAGLSVCLDACEICPPEGYGQRGGDVVCVYCRTPIPVDTLGKTGGCNPVPLNAAVSDVDIRISIDEIAFKWKSIKSGKTKEAVK